MRTLSIAILATLLPLPALAGGHQHPSGQSEQQADDAIVPTGIQEFDSVFSRVTAIHGSLDQAQAKLAQANDSINVALALPQGTPIADAMAQLQQRAQHKVELYMDGHTPKLRATDAVPDEVQAAIDSVNTATGQAAAAAASIEGLPQESADVVQAAAALPGQLSIDILKRNHKKLTDLNKVRKDLDHDVDVTRATPDRVKAVQDEFGRFFKGIEGAFTAG